MNNVVLNPDHLFAVKENMEGLSRDFWGAQSKGVASFHACTQSLRQSVYISLYPFILCLCSVVVGKLGRDFMEVKGHSGGCPSVK